MAKRSEWLNDALKTFYTTVYFFAHKHIVLRMKHVTKEKENEVLMRGKVLLFHLDEFSNYYFSRFARKLKYLKFISVK